VFEKQRKIVMGARLMAVHGLVQRDPDSDVIHVVARRLEDHSSLLWNLTSSEQGGTGKDAKLDNSDCLTMSAEPNEQSWRQPASRHPRDVKIIPKSRDFH
jgi:error-prone DNA polymerase